MRVAPARPLRLPCRGVFFHSVSTWRAGDVSSKTSLARMARGAMRPEAPDTAGSVEWPTPIPIPTAQAGSATHSKARKSQEMKRGRSGLREEALDEIAVLLRDGLALEFERGREGAIGHGQIVGDDLESPDLLEIREAAIHALHVGGDLLARGRSLGDDERRDVLPPFAQHEDFVDARRFFQCVLDQLWCHLLSARRDDDVLLAIGDANVSVGVDGANVARVEPPALECLRRFLGPVPVALHDDRALHEDLAVLGDLHLDLVERRSDGSDPLVAEAIHADRGGGFGQAVAFENRLSDAAEEQRHFPVQRGTAGYT